MNNSASILALHGFTGGGADFSGFSELALPDATWACPDLPGHGANSGLACNPEQVIDIIERNASRLKSEENHTPKILLGYSMGGRAALLHACRFPEQWDALVLISANPGIESEADRKTRREADAVLAEQIIEEGVTAFIRQWQEQALIRSQKNINAKWYAAMQQTREQNQTAGLAANLRQFGQGSCPNLWPALKVLKMPVLLISGAEDEKYIAIAAEVEKRILSSRHACIEASGHMPHLEQPKRTADALRAFISDL